MSAKPVGKMTAEQIAAQLDALEPASASPVDDDAKTMKEWAALWKCPMSRAEKRIHNGLAHKRMEMVKRPRKQIDGRTQARTCYRFITNK